MARFKNSKENREKVELFSLWLKKEFGDKSLGVTAKDISRKLIESSKKDGSDLLFSYHDCFSNSGLEPKAVAFCINKITGFDGFKKCFTRKKGGSLVLFPVIDGKSFVTMRIEMVDKSGDFIVYEDLLLETRMALDIKRKLDLYSLEMLK